MLDSGVYTPRLGELIRAQDDPLRPLNIGTEVVVVIDGVSWQALGVTGVLIGPLT